jgi:glucose/arabinose dehydrogenase/mono/diheme cytochrome c family protein
MEDKGLLRLTLSPDANQIGSVETINDELQECRGLLFAHDALYVNANNSKGLYRLRDSNGDDQFDEVRLLYESSGGVGHGRNDLALGPDGDIYSIHGDAVDLPTGFVDRTSPFREQRRGGKSREGHVIRTDAEGKSWELLAAGLRNPFGIDFNADGEMFTYDADAEFDMGAPWYRPTRVNHIVPGGDYGWRGVTGDWPPYFPDHPDNAPPNLDIGKGSPTAVKFGYRSQFPQQYQQALFILDWAYGRILAVHMVPRGASYFCQASTFLRGRPLNVTDLDFGPAGQMYFVTGGRKTRSALYRVRYIGDAPDQEAPTLQQQSRRVHTRAARQVRRQLETLHHAVGAAAIEESWPRLASADPWIRHAARVAVEHQPLELWRQRALSEERPLASLASLLALARSRSPAVMPSILNRLNGISIADQPASFKRTALYVYELCLSDLSALDAQSAVAAAAKLEPLYPDSSNQVNRRLSDLLVRLDVASVIPKTLVRLQAANDQTERIHCLFVLRNAKNGWTVDGRRRYWTALRRTSDFLGGEGMRGFIENIRRDALDSLSDEDKTALAELLEEPSAIEAETALTARPIVKRWSLAELARPNDVDRTPDYEQGKKMFAAALCARCHRMGQQGTPLGPDLTSVARRFSRQDILQSIMEPSQVIAENYRSQQVVTGKLVEIPKSEIEEYSLSATSYMPTGLLDTLTHEEILDLLAYIESGGNPQHPIFSRPIGVTR